MDGTNFDIMSRIFGNGRSRRRAATLLCGGAVAILRGRIVPQEAAAACRTVGNKCDRRGQCCSGLCKGPPGKKKCRAAGPEGTCKPGQDTCSVPFPLTCNGSSACQCLVATSGASFCADFALPTACDADADCAFVTGPGSACVQIAACGQGDTACARPCSQR